MVSKYVLVWQLQPKMLHPHTLQMWVSNVQQQVFDKSGKRSKTARKENIIIAQDASTNWASVFVNTC